MNKDGGLLDDLMIGRPAAPGSQGMLYIVVNAATKDGDFALFEAAAKEQRPIPRPAVPTRAGADRPAGTGGRDRAGRDGSSAPPTLTFMTFRRFDYDGDQIVVARSGYTGEDGCEILVKPHQAAQGLPGPSSWPTNGCGPSV